MARPREAPTTKVNIAEFANDELGILSTILTNRAKRHVSRPRILGALVLAARELPPEVVESLFPAYDVEAARFIEAED